MNIEDQLHDLITVLQNKDYHLDTDSEKLDLVEYLIKIKEKVGQVEDELQKLQEYFHVTGQ